MRLSTWLPTFLVPAGTCGGSGSGSGGGGLRRQASQPSRGGEKHAAAASCMQHVTCGYGHASACPYAHVRIRAQQRVRCVEGRLRRAHGCCQDLPGSCLLGAQGTITQPSCTAATITSPRPIGVLGAHLNLHLSGGCPPPLPPPPLPPAPLPPAAPLGGWRFPPRQPRPPCPRRRPAAASGRGACGSLQGGGGGAGAGGGTGGLHLYLPTYLPIHRYSTVTVMFKVSVARQAASKANDSTSRACTA